jgi:hypothetical protein
LKNSRDKPWVKTAEPIFTMAWFGEANDQAGAQGDIVWEAGCGDNEGRTSHNTHDSKIINVSNGKFSREDVPEYVPYYVLVEKEEARKKAEEERKKREEEARIAKQKKQQEYQNKPETKLLDAYVDYLMLKNLYESNYYGTSAQMKQIKKLIKSIESHYKNLINTSADNVWQRAKNNYNSSFAESISFFSSSFSTKGQALFTLTLNSLVYKASDIGVSPGNTDKDF